MRDINKQEQSHKYLKKHVKLFKEESPQVLDTCVDAAMELVMDAIRVPAVLQVDDILVLDAVKHLKTKQDKSGHFFALLETLFVISPGNFLEKCFFPAMTNLIN